MAQRIKRADADIQKTESQPFAKDPYRLKKAWERLQKIQDEMPARFRKRQADFQISSVKIVKNAAGQETVQVSLLNGKKLWTSAISAPFFKK